MHDLDLDIWNCSRSNVNIRIESSIHYFLFDAIRNVCSIFLQFQARYSQSKWTWHWHWHFERVKVKSKYASHMSICDVIFDDSSRNCPIWSPFSHLLAILTCTHLQSFEIIMNGLPKYCRFESLTFKQKVTVMQNNIGDYIVVWQKLIADSVMKSMWIYISNRFCVVYQ